MTKESNSAHNERLMVSARIRPVDFSRGTGQKVVAAYDSQTLVFLEPGVVSDPEHPFRNSSCSRPNRHNHQHQQNGLYSHQNNPKTQNGNAEGKLYEFDFVFNENSSQEEVYKNTAGPLVRSVLEGFCATVFAYGATGSGKTYTMVGTPQNPGIMARSVDDIFKLCVQTGDESKIDVFLSYLEVYNEHIRDLLRPVPIQNLELREDKDQVHVAGLSEIRATSTAEVLTLLHRGNKARTVEPTAANTTSSRSHAVFTSKNPLKMGQTRALISQIFLKLPVTVRQESNETGDIIEGKLFLIDLAGSERASNTKNSGIRLREGAHINRSLLALGNCITALASGDSDKYINYRDSKLTRILKVTPSSVHIEETRNTLLYAQRARAISNRVRKFIYNPSQSEPNFIIQELKSEVKRLQNKLLGSTVTQRSRSPPTPSKQAFGQKIGIQKASSMSPDQTLGQKLLQSGQQQSEEMDYSDLHPTMSLSPELRREFMGKHEKPDLRGIKEEITALFEKEFKLRNDLLKLDGAMLQSALDCEILRLMVLDWENLKHARDSDSSESGGSGPSTDSDPGRNEINSVMTELKTVRQEQQKLLKTRNSVEVHLKETRSRIYTVEEEASDYLPEIQREILSHLCKLQQDQVQKMSVEIESELKRRGSLLLRCLRQKALGEAIIHRQRHFLKAVSKPQSHGYLKYAEGIINHSSSIERLDQDQNSSFLPRLTNPSEQKRIIQEVKCDVHSPPYHHEKSSQSDSNSSESHLPPLLISNSNGNLQVDLPLVSKNHQGTTKYSEFKKSRQFAGNKRESHAPPPEIDTSDDDDDDDEIISGDRRLLGKSAKSAKSLKTRNRNLAKLFSQVTLNDPELMKDQVKADNEPKKIY